MAWKNRWSLIGVILTLSLLPRWAWSNAGLPMITMFPVMLYALIPVIAIEVYVFRRYLRAPLKKAVYAVGLANIASTFLGYPVVWTFLFAVQLGSEALFANLFRFFPANILWEPAKLLTFPLRTAWLPPSDELHWMLPAAGIVNLTAAFFVSVYSEYWIEKKFFGSEQRQIIRLAAWRANMASYLLLILVLFGWLGYESVTAERPERGKQTAVFQCFSEPDSFGVHLELSLNSIGASSDARLIEKHKNKVIQVASICLEAKNSGINPGTHLLDYLEFRCSSNSLNFDLDGKQEQDGHIFYPAELNAEGATVSGERKRYQVLLKCEIYDLDSLRP